VENKSKEKIKILTNRESIFISLIIIFYFFYGFYTNENSAGAGGYDGDFKLIWSNLELLRNGILANLDSPLYNDSRTPLSYILHIYLNPLSANQEFFRITALFISLLIPILLYFAIKESYPKLELNLIILLSLLVTLSPYFRTTAFWGLGENYGLIFVILSYLTLQSFKNKFSKNTDFLNILTIFFSCLFSSLIVYFDQKLIFIPILILFVILTFKVKLSIKFSAIFFYTIFALPYLYLINLWGAIIPPSAAEAREVGLSIHLYNPIFCMIILSIYIFPFLFFGKKNVLLILQENLNKKFFIYFSLMAIYFLIVINIVEFESLGTQGKGAFYKLTLILFENYQLQIIVTFIGFLISFLVVYLFSSSKNIFFILFFLILSLFTYPFYQEYLDPITYILFFTFFYAGLNFNRSNIYFLILYLLLFSLGSKFYYSILL